MTLRIVCAASAIFLLILSGPANAQMRITEWAYQGPEYVEFTNVGAVAIDMTGWSYDDDSRTPGVTSLSAFGIVQPGLSVVLAEDTEATFRGLWGPNLPASVPVIGENAANLGRNDEINLFDNLNALVDRLAYGDQTFPGTIRAQADVGGAGIPSGPAALGANNVSLWQSAQVGDAFGSWQAPGGTSVGNPGRFVPEPSSILLLVAGTIGLALGRRPGR
jgi:hypothetical protein